MEGKKRSSLVEERSLNYVTVHQQLALLRWPEPLAVTFYFVRVHRLVLATLEMSRAMLSLLCYPHPQLVT